MKKPVLSPSQPPAPISIPLNPRRTEDQFSSVPGGGMVHCANLNAARCFKGPWMESQLILLSAIPTPSELRAAGAMSSEASRGRSPASFRSSAPRGSAFDPPAAARAPPTPHPPRRQAHGGFAARFEPAPSLGYGRGGGRGSCDRPAGQKRSLFRRGARREPGWEWGGAGGAGKRPNTAPST